MPFLFWILGLNSIVGLLIFEWAWSSSKKLRIRNEAIESKYPAFRRNDVWRKWKYYPGALTFFLLRMLIALNTFILAYIVSLLVSIG